MKYANVVETLRLSRKLKPVVIVTFIVIAFILIKVIWVTFAINGNGTFESEKKDILQRRNWLISKVITEPQKLIDEMPSVVGPQFQGEWALYSCSMLSSALVNISRLYPETAEENLMYVDSLIGIVLSPEIREYDRARWDEDPLESLAGGNSHVSYISLLANMINVYKCLGGDSKYDDLWHSLCRTMNRRILSSDNFCLPTYPGEYVYIPDMLAAIAALEQYSRLNRGKYHSTVMKWVGKAKTEWLDEDTGLLPAIISEFWLRPPVRGSYSALSCYYLTYIDDVFAKEQYCRFRETFLKRFPITGFKEYNDRGCLLGFDIDAGPIIFSLSPSGTAFGAGPVTYYGDMKLRKKIMTTAEMAGTTVSIAGRRHYLLADVALVGEAIMLAMRTHSENMN